MDFAKLVSRDVMIYTIPWVICRALVYPLVNINSKLQRENQKKQDENPGDITASSQPRFTSLNQKINCFNRIIVTEGYQGLFDRWEFYIVPFTTSRIVEGIFYFGVMRFFSEIVGFSDIFFIFSTIAIFVCGIFGALVFLVTSEVLENKALDLKALLDFKNRAFWKQYEIYHIWYQVYGYFQSYPQMISYWYFTPLNVFLEIPLYAFSRIVGVVGSTPFGWINRYAKDFNFDYSKTFQHISKKHGTTGFFAGLFLIEGARDGCIVEVILSIIQVPLNYLVELMI